MKFKELSKEENSKVESKISKYWEEHKILDKSIEQRKKYFVFYDVPATVNPLPVKRYNKLISLNSLLN